MDEPRDPTRDDRHEKALVILLRVAGAVCLLGLIGVFLPSATMAEVHAALGFGEFPQRPITVYLARATSALCGLYGGFMLLLSRDVRRYRVAIAFQAVGIMVVCSALAVASIGLGRLFWFIAADAAACAAFAIPVLWLLRRIG